MFEKYRSLFLAGLSVLAVLFFAALIVPVSYKNTAADAETFVVQVKDDCASTYDNGIKAVIEMAQVDSNTKQFLKGLIDNPSQDPKQARQINEAYGQFVNGNPAPFMLLMGSISNTNFTATAENVQREINAQRAAMLTCSTALNRSQKALKEALGMDASGRVVKWPQTWIHMDFPSEQSDPLLRDNDADGRLTVLDYRPPVDITTREAFGTGDGIPPVTLYPTP